MGKLPLPYLGTNAMTFPTEKEWIAASSLGRTKRTAGEFDSFASAKNKTRRLSMERGGRQTTMDLVSIIPLWGEHFVEPGLTLFCSTSSWVSNDGRLSEAKT